MKNKTKKILACAALGVVGMGCLSGCSISEEQQQALDLVTKKSDEIVNLLEENLEYKNKQLSKEDAAEKILLAKSRWKLQQFDEFEWSMIQNSYYGIFDELKSTYSSNETTPWRMIYRNSENTKVMASIDGDTWDEISISNFDEDKHLVWNNGDNSFTTREYKSSDFHIIDIFQAVGITTITSEQVKDIEIVENGYIFKVIIEDNDTYSEVTFNVSFDNYITSLTMNQIKDIKEGLVEDFESWFIECKFKYDNVDFSALDTKITELSTTK